MAQECAEVLGRRSVAVGDYDDFASAVLDRANNAVFRRLAGEYDAMLFGWGSLSHLLSDQEIQRVFAAAAQITRGPILVSFLHGPIPRTARGRRVQRLAAALGQRLSGRSLLSADEQVILRADAGFARYFTDEEVHRWGEPIARTVIFDRWPYPHATLTAVRGAA